MEEERRLQKVVRIFPGPHKTLPLHGLYLHHEIAVKRDRPSPFVYANYVVSMDGRIALTLPQTGEKVIPAAITNPSDWRLYQELAAQADVLVASGRYMREFAEDREKGGLPVSDDKDYADLHQWRLSHGLSRQPAVAVITSSLDLPWELICKKVNRPVYAITTDKANPADVDKIRQLGVTTVEAGNGNRIEGARLVNGLAKYGFNNIYVIAGPKVLGTLIADHALDRLYLTQVHKLVGGRVYDTFLESSYLEKPVDLKLRCLYQHISNDKSLEQSFAVFDVHK
ncbi:MAG: dihydrofolate reductase family protein [Gammaproteobacteria bacterium]|jgi:riboflavin biosynthesis pyrimidine reductase